MLAQHPVWVVDEILVDRRIGGRVAILVFDLDGTGLYPAIVARRCARLSLLQVDDVGYDLGVREGVVWQADRSDQVSMV